MASARTVRRDSVGTMLKREVQQPPEHLFPPDEWRIVEARFTERYSDRTETVFALSNGYLGVRGTLRRGTPGASPGTFVNGFHETWPIVHAEEAYGLARIGQTIVNVPDATILQLYVDDEPLFLPTARLRGYARVLDMRDGTLVARARLVDAGGQARDGALVPARLARAPAPRWRSRTR